MAKYNVAMISLVAGMIAVAALAAWTYYSMHFISVSMEGDTVIPVSQLEDDMPDFEHYDREAFDSWLHQMYKSRGSEPFMYAFIYGLNDTYALDDKISFTAVEAGYDNSGCSGLHVMIKNKDTGKTHWEYWHVHSCPAPSDVWYPVTRITAIPYSDSSLPPIMEPGNYVVFVESKFGASAQKEFTVLPSDHTFEYDLVYTRDALLDAKGDKMSIDLNTGHFTTNLLLSGGDLSQKELGVLKNATSRVLDSHSAEYESWCDDCQRNSVVITLDDYRYSLSWYGGETGMSQDQLDLVRAVTSIHQSINDKIRKIS